jgi:hypothetical protein
MATPAKRWRGRNADLTDEAIFIAGDTLTRTATLLKEIEDKGLDPVRTTAVIGNVANSLAAILRTLEQIGLED